MKFTSYSLAEAPFNFDIQWPFLTTHRKIIEDAISHVKIESLSEVSKLEELLDRQLRNKGYLWDKLNKAECSLWRPDFNMLVDFFNPSEKIAIEVEKTEVKRIIHDILKLMNGSLTFVSKVRYGVLIYPKKYKRVSGKESPFHSILTSQVSFYFKSLLPYTKLNDILLISYDL